jgi:Phage integrase, N-terminal SAM-like domain
VVGTNMREITISEQNDVKILRASKFQLVGIKSRSGQIRYTCSELEEEHKLMIAGQKNIDVKEVKNIHLEPLKKPIRHLFVANNGGGSAEILAADPFIDAGGKEIVYNILQFFIDNSLASTTRRAYANAIGALISWCENGGVANVLEIREPDIREFIESTRGSTSRQRLAAVRSVFSYLHERQLLPANPAASVHAPLPVPRAIALDELQLIPI